MLHALVRECRDMGPTLESRVSGPLGRHGVLVWAGLAAGIFCYVMYHGIIVLTGVVRTIRISAFDGER